VLVLALAPAGCGVLSQEEQILSDFFQAARLRDTVMAARVSSADFHPLADGIVERFDLIGGSAPEDAGEGRRVVTIAAVVRRPDGVTEPRRMTATFERGPAGRWRLARLAPPQ
jgi:hypothetical protein